MPKKTLQFEEYTLKQTIVCDIPRIIFWNTSIAKWKFSFEPNDNIWIKETLLPTYSGWIKNEESLEESYLCPRGIRRL